jgi:flagellar hook protein FlgE
MGAFSIPLSGLAASSDWLNVISNNLANLNTDGYKDESLNFGDLFNQMQSISGNGDPIQVGDGVTVAGETSNFADGTITQTGISSNMALQGNGYFVVQGGNGQNDYTRDGNFSVNSQGQLTNSNGQLVMGYPAVNGQVSTTAALGPINVNEASTIPAQATTSFSIDANLNASSATGTTFSSPITVYDSLGNSHDLTVNYTNTGTNAWSYTVSIPSADVAGTGTSTTLATGTMSFNSSGQLTSPTSPVSLNITGLADGASNMSLSWNLTSPNGSAITQQASASATTATNQNGYAVGTLTGYAVTSDGTVEGQFSNNQTIALGQVAVANFANQQGLTQVGNNNYEATTASGAAIVGQAGIGGNGTIEGGAVEESNVSLSTEFSNMIIAQQSYDANAKALTTMDQVTQATIQLVS